MLEILKNYPQEKYQNLNIFFFSLIKTVWMFSALSNLICSFLLCGHFNFDSFDFLMKSWVTNQFRLPDKTNSFSPFTSFLVLSCRFFVHFFFFVLSESLSTIFNHSLMLITHFVSSICQPFSFLLIQFVIGHNKTCTC